MNSQTKIEGEPKQNCCSICDGIGFIPIIDTTGHTRYSPCKCREIVRAQRIWEQSGININDIDKSFANFEIWNNQTKAMKDRAISYYINFNNIKHNRHNSILLCGNSGCGKTHLSLALANNLLKNKKVAVTYFPYRDVITRLKQNITDKDYYKKTLDKYKNAEVLLIDDLFKGKVNDTDINIMFEIVNHRYLNLCPMIVSTEFTVDKLLYFDEAIGSRIYEMAKKYICQIQGSSSNYRMR